MPASNLRLESSGIQVKNVDEKGGGLSIQIHPIIDANLFQIAQNKRKATREHKQHVGTSTHFYLLKGALICGHCGNPMGGRTHMAGHQKVYYCVQKERLWKTRGEDHPKWKRGTGCSMVRSANIAKTDQIVWDIVKPVLLMLQDRPMGTSDEAGPEHRPFIESDGNHNDKINRLSAEEIDQFSDEEKRAAIQHLITEVSVFFDVVTAKHRLDVEFTKAVSQALQAASISQVFTDDVEERIEGTSGDVKDDGGCAVGEDAGKKLWGSQINLAAYQNYSVTVE
jgi:hypothetical protein